DGAAIDLFSLAHPREVHGAAGPRLPHGVPADVVELRRQRLSRHGHALRIDRAELHRERLMQRRPALDHPHAGVDPLRMHHHAVAPGDGAVRRVAYLRFEREALGPALGQDLEGGLEPELTVSIEHALARATPRRAVVVPAELQTACDEGP